MRSECGTLGEIEGEGTGQTSPKSALLNDTKLNKDTLYNTHYIGFCASLAITDQLSYHKVHRNEDILLLRYGV